MKLIICGSRNMTRYTYLKNKCLEIIPKIQYELEVPTWEIELVSGGANGTDTLGEQLAQDYKMKVKRFPLTSEDWNDMTPPVYPKYRPDGTAYNALAGNKRNQRMLDYCLESGEPSCTIGFVLGKSTGTKDMIKISKKAEFPTWVVYVEKDAVRVHNLTNLKIGLN